jgi:hypothetical protein
MDGSRGKFFQWVSELAVLHLRHPSMLLNIDNRILSILQHQLLHELHEEGIKREEIIESLGKITFVMCRLLNLAFYYGTTRLTDTFFVALYELMHESIYRIPPCFKSSTPFVP